MPRDPEHRARVLSWVWWAQAPIVLITYWLVSQEPTIEKLILAYLAFVSVVANAVTYGGKASAEKARKAAEAGNETTG